MVKPPVKSPDKATDKEPVPPEMCIYAETCKYAVGDAGPTFSKCDGIKPNCRMYRPQVDPYPPCTDCGKRGKCTRCATFVSWADWHREQRMQYMQEHNVGAFP